MVKPNWRRLHPRFSIAATMGTDARAGKDNRLDAGAVRSSDYVACNAIGVA